MVFMNAKAFAGFAKDLANFAVKKNPIIKRLLRLFFPTNDEVLILNSIFCILNSAFSFFTLHLPQINQTWKHIVLREHSDFPVNTLHAAY